MAISIKNNNVIELARALSKRTGESVTQTILVALTERYERIKKRTMGLGTVELLSNIGKRICELPDLDTRSADDILGYNNKGFIAHGD